MSRRAREVGARHYPLFVLLHGAWIVALIVAIAPDTTFDPWLFSLFVLLQLARLWVITSLGERWTTRVIVVPGEPLINTGPYRFLRHPNYAIVVLEIALVPAMFGAWLVALVFSALNLALLRYRIRVEEAALAEAG